MPVVAAAHLDVDPGVILDRKERGALVVELLRGGDADDLEKRKRSKPRR